MIKVLDGCKRTGCTFLVAGRSVDGVFKVLQSSTSKSYESIYSSSINCACKEILLMCLLELSAGSWRLWYPRVIKGFIHLNTGWKIPNGYLFYRNKKESWTALNLQTTLTDECFFSDDTDYCPTYVKYFCPHTSTVVDAEGAKAKIIEIKKRNWYRIVFILFVSCMCFTVIWFLMVFKTLVRSE